MTTTRVKAQDAVFTNSGTFSATNFMQLAPGFPLSTATSTGIKLGFNYSPLAHRMNVYGGGYRNSWHINGIGKPYQTWQEQMLFNLYKPNYAPPSLFNPGIRYLANRQNWGGYQAVFGLKERVSDFSLMNSEESTFSYLENSEPKDAVISFSFPYSTPETHKPRLIFETVELDTFYASTAPGDMQTELATLTHNGNLGFRTSNPSARIEINGNEGLGIVASKPPLAVAVHSANPNNFTLTNANYGSAIGFGTDDPIATIDIRKNAGNGSSKAISIQNNSGVENFYVNNGTTSDLFNKGTFNMFGNAKSIIRTDGLDLFLEYIKTGINGFGILTVDNVTGKIGTLNPNPPGFGGVYWQTSGNGFVNPNPTTVKLGTMTWDDIDLIANNIVYGHIYAENSGLFTSSPPAGVGIGNVRFNTSLSIGGPDFGTSTPILYPQNSTSLRLMTRTQIGVENIANPDLLIEGIEQGLNRIFAVYNSGETEIGKVTNSAIKNYAMLTIGDIANTKSAYLSIAHFKNSTGDLIWGLGHNEATLYLGNNSYLNSTLNEMVWDGDILPYNNNTIPNTGYDLGSASQRWNEIYLANSPNVSSDLKLKEDISNIDSSLSLVLKLRPVSYYWKDRTADSASHFGFIAQELKRVFPSQIVVGNEERDTLGVRYEELIPVLTKAIQEQNRMILDQQKALSQLKDSLLTYSILESNKSASTILNKEPILFQNTPNPFENTTHIDYFIPEGSTQASLAVIDGTGKMIYSAQINSFGMGRVILEDKQIAQGNYFYSLYVNGRLIDSKQMQVVKR